MSFPETLDFSSLPRPRASSPAIAGLPARAIRPHAAESLVQSPAGRHAPHTKWPGEPARGSVDIIGSNLCLAPWRMV